MDILEFCERAGFWPARDDLERASCRLARLPGHSDCGLCATCGMPRFVPCPCRYPRDISEAQCREDGRHARAWGAQFLDIPLPVGFRLDLLDVRIQDAYLGGVSPQEAHEMVTSET